MNFPVKIALAAILTTLSMGLAKAQDISIEEAQKAMSSGYDAEYTPNAERHAIYDVLYAKYKKMGSSSL